MRRRALGIAIVLTMVCAVGGNLLAGQGYLEIYSKTHFPEQQDEQRNLPQFVNAGGAVAGQTTDVVTGALIKHAFVWTLSDGLVDIGTLGSSTATIVGFNDNGVAAGNSPLADGQRAQAFVWSKQDGMRDIGTLGVDRLGNSSAEAAAINQSNWVVGTSSRPGNKAFTGAFLWTPAGHQGTVAARARLRRRRQWRLGRQRYRPRRRVCILGTTTRLE